MNAIIYTRFSPRPKEAADKCESIEDQVAACQAFAAEQGWPVKSIHADREISGSVLDRPGIRDALADLGRGDVLLVFKLDRLSRSSWVGALLDREIQAKGAVLRSTHGEGTEGNAPTDEFVTGITRLVDELQRKTGAERTRVAMLRRQADGQCMSKILPYGWRPNGVPGRMEHDPEEQEIIRRIVAMRKENEKISLRGIGTKLTEEGVLCRGGAWRHQTVKAILQRQQEQR